MLYYFKLIVLWLFVYSFENLSPASRHALSLHVVDTEGCEWSKDNWLVHNGTIEEFFFYSTVLIYLYV